jgi:GT2 family glycosyltransferase
MIVAEHLNPLVSVIIVTWNGQQYALECLASLAQNTSTLPIEVIVVDNRSTDGTPDEICRQFPAATLIRNEANFGFAKANNIGLAVARGRYLCLVNSDVVVPPGCLERMVSFMERNPGIGILGPKMLKPGGGIGQSTMRLPTVWNTLCCSLGLHTVFPNSKLFGGFLLKNYKYDSIDDVEVLTGWFWMVGRQSFEEVGGLDERFFIYGEDIDWSYRFRKAGWRVVFYPESEALHYGGASSAQAPTRFYVEMRRANLQYFRKHHGRLGGAGYKAAVLVHELVRVAGNGVLYCCYRSRRSLAAFAISRSVSSIRWLAGRK